MNINLNLINNSNDSNNSEIVIFQKNEATDFDETVVAWKVLKNCAQGWSHSFVFPKEIHVSASDSWGNEIIDPIVAENGQLFHVFCNTSGDQLAYSGPSNCENEVQLRNDLVKGSIDALIYKAGRLLAKKTGISPTQKAVFQFKPTIWVGVVSQIQEGDVMNSAVLSDIHTELNLKGIASADIVMTGGGVGPNSSPFQFTLENIVYA